MNARANDNVLTIEPEALAALQRVEHYNPHGLLGSHPVDPAFGGGVLVRAFHPDAESCDVVLENGEARPMQPLGGGVFGLHLPDLGLPLQYRLRFTFPGGGTWERRDPYRFLPTVGEMDLYLFGEGTHRKLWHALGARPMELDGVAGTAFTVWAPNAKRVSVVGAFNNWDGRLMPMRSLGGSGVWELFVPDVRPGELYKYEIKTQMGDLRVKTDPFARRMECPPHTASIVYESHYQWGDGDWMRDRAGKDITREPVHIYELHLGSWARVPEDGYRSMSYREIAPRLVDHVKKLGFTHVELMPLAEHAFYPSWGYQVTGYYAPTARYGDPDDLKYFVDYCHRHGVGVIVDWVPAHFPKDDFALRRFDGTALYEHEDTRRGEHPDWGTLIFNYGRREVRSFLIANAIYWLHEFHIDGLRVDAVASMLYLDYSRTEGQWVPNVYGGRENLDAIDFLRAMNVAVREEAPGAFTVAEESTAWGGITRPPEAGGLGFTFKWNMGWMHDTLGYFQKEPVHRKYHQDQLTFAMLYEYTERFINSISHDEVVHGKGSLIEKMPGDFWQKLANLRLILAYQVTRPGKQLVFMGTEIGQHGEWNVDSQVDWHIADHPQRQALLQFMAELGKMYAERRELWRDDPSPESFEWIDCSDRDNSVLVFVRRVCSEGSHGQHCVVVLNLTPVPREDYRIGVPQAGRYLERLSSDDARFGGSDFETARELHSEPISAHGRDQSLLLRLPPLGALVLVPG
jgi:1,4-alpha-glucan branching enzyme